MTIAELLRSLGMDPDVYVTSADIREVLAPILAIYPALDQALLRLEEKEADVAFLRHQLLNTSTN
jgi:hypothetical protein